jgi:hypothetical protein
MLTRISGAAASAGLEATLRDSKQGLEVQLSVQDVLFMWALKMSPFDGQAHLRPETQSSFVHQA